MEGTEARVAAQHATRPQMHERLGHLERRLDGLERRVAGVERRVLSVSGVLGVLIGVLMRFYWFG